MEVKLYRYLLVAVTLIGMAAFCAPQINTSASTAQAKDEKSDAQVAPSDMSCPKCKSAMEEGFVRDYFNQNSFDPAAWSPKGEKQHLFTWGKMIKMIAYRCSNCGYVEYYAR